MRTLHKTAAVALLCGAAAAAAWRPLPARADGGAPADMLQTPAAVATAAAPVGEKPRHHHRAPTPEESASPTPAPFGTLDGTWEVQLQPGSLTVYSSLFLLMQGDAVNGRWTREKAVTPISGSVSGDRFTLSGTDKNGPFTLSGYLENEASMIGLFAQAGKSTPFTASHKGLPKNEIPAKKHHKHKK